MTTLFSFNTVAKKGDSFLYFLPLKTQFSICVKVTTDLLDGRGCSLLFPQPLLLKVHHSQLYTRSTIFNFKRLIQVMKKDKI